MARPQCFKVENVSKEGHTALKMLAKGEATEYQQRLALKIIVNNFARSHDNCFIPGETDQSNFIAGRAFVGQQVLLYLGLPVGKLTQQEDDGDGDQTTKT